MSDHKLSNVGLACVALSIMVSITLLGLLIVNLGLIAVMYTAVCLFFISLLALLLAAVMKAFTSYLDTLLFTNVIFNILFSIVVFSFLPHNIFFVAAAAVGLLLAVLVCAVSKCKDTPIYNWFFNNPDKLTETSAEELKKMLQNKLPVDQIKPYLEQYKDYLEKLLPDNTKNSIDTDPQLAWTLLEALYNILPHSRNNAEEINAEETFVSRFFEQDYNVQHPEKYTCINTWVKGFKADAAKSFSENLESFLLDEAFNDTWKRAFDHSNQNALNQYGLNLYGKCLYALYNLFSTDIMKCIIHGKDDGCTYQEWLSEFDKSHPNKSFQLKLLCTSLYKSLTNSLHINVVFGEEWIADQLSKNRECTTALCEIADELFQSWKKEESLTLLI